MINIGFLVPIHWIGSFNISLALSAYSRVPRSPGLLFLYLTRCWGVPQFFYAWNLPTGTTAPSPNSCSDTFSRMSAPPKSNPSSVAKAEKQSMPDLVSFQGHILSPILRRDFLYISLAQHSILSGQLFPMCAQYV